MKKNIIIFIAIIIVHTNILYSKPLIYKEFILGDSKKNILAILSTQKYSGLTIYYDSNDRYFGDIKVKSENSIKIVIREYMKKEEILLVFDAGDKLFDIYVKITPIDARDYIDNKINMIETYGKPIKEETVNTKHILAWSLNKKENAVYFIYDSVNESMIINFRDTNLNKNYIPAFSE